MPRCPYLERMSTDRTTLPAIGAVLREKYRLERVLGEGGYGRVYLAVELGTQRQVAVKVLKQTEAKLALRFKREARAIARLSSPNTLTLFDYGEHEGCLFMVTEFVEGEDLADRLFRGPLEEAELIHVLIQVLSSLEEAHQAGVLHRDIKPANIRVFSYADDPLCVKVLDFGLAKAVDGREVALTKTGAVIGTPRYMSPEHLTGGTMSPATDVFSVGIVAIECLLGRESMLVADLSNRLTGLRLTDEHPVSEPLRTILNRMLAKELDARYRSAGAAKRDLIALARGESVEKGRSTPELPVQPRPQPVAHYEDPDRVASRPLWPLASAAVVVMGLAVVGVVVSTRTDSDEPPPRPAVRAVPIVVSGVSSEPDPIEAPEPAPGSDCVPPFVGSGYVEEQTHALDAATYYTYVPEGLSPGARHPLLILFHQAGHTGKILAEQGGFVELAEEHKVIVVAPTEADFTAWAPQADHVPVARRALDVVIPQLCIDEERIFAVGHGSGAGVAAHLACRELVAGFATHALSLDERRLPCEPYHPVPNLMFYPTDSGYEPIQGGETCSSAHRVAVEVVEEPLLERHDCKRVDPRVYEDGTKCWTFDCAGPALQSCHVKGGHGWTGTDIRPQQYRMMDCDGPNPTFPIARHIGDFFAPYWRRK